MLTGDDIREQLGLPEGIASERCAEMLCDRKLSVEPVIRPLLESALVAPEARDEVLGILRSFRAAVRGLDDLLDGADADPNGHVAAWLVCGRATTAATAIALWERALARAAGSGREALLTESHAMLTAARREEEARREVLSGKARKLGALRSLELSLRDKEIAYWRLIGGLVRGYWRSTDEQYRRLMELFVHAAHVWQRLDDVRDFETDLEHGRLSSFMIELLDGVDPEQEVLWPRAIDAHDAADLHRRREARLAMLTDEARRAEMRIRQFRDGLAEPRSTANTSRSHYFET